MSPALTDVLDIITDPSHPGEVLGSKSNGMLDFKNGSMLDTTTTSNGESSASILRKSNPSLQVTANQTIKLVPNSPIESPSPDCVLLHIKTTGVCGSDIHFWHSGGIGPQRIDRDCILGHEAAGIVLQCGSAVTTLKPGDRVAIEPGVSCDDCYMCAEGKYNLCEDQRFAGVCPYAGTFQRYKTHPAKWCHKMPDGMTFAQGALLEPLSVVLHGINLVGLSIGRGVAICGAGPIGMVALLCARASGAHPIVITDLEPRRLKFAKELVPSCRTYQVDRSLDAQGNGTAIKTLFGEKEYDAPSVVIEAVGVESSICTAAYAARKSGTVMVIGVGKSTMNNLPFMHLNLGEVSTQDPAMLGWRC